MKTEKPIPNPYAVRRQIRIAMLIGPLVIFILVGAYKAFWFNQLTPLGFVGIVKGLTLVPLFICGIYASKIQRKLKILLPEINAGDLDRELEIVKSLDGELLQLVQWNGRLQVLISFFLASFFALIAAVLVDYFRETF